MAGVCKTYSQSMRRLMFRNSNQCNAPKTNSCKVTTWTYSPLDAWPSLMTQTPLIRPGRWWRNPTLDHVVELLDPKLPLLRIVSTFPKSLTFTLNLNAEECPLVSLDRIPSHGRPDPLPNGRTAPW